MALLAFALLAILLPQQARGPAGDDDGTGIAARPLTRQRCPVPTDPNEIVVCKRDEPDRYRIGPQLAAPPQRRALDPSIRLPGAGEVRAEAQQHSAGIASVPAAFVTLRIPLGGKKKKPDDPQK
ncbi:hypothetical protein CA233_08835 [Sphingomonas sp. ABOLD]|uniref:Uncharacterized protein n=1 Tax=Sphingomonas trueperi TaxID=53317 RepID=A0A7X5XXP2_9SPHN|nr:MULTISPECIES: hypothetical protein [Sphingomonas]NJB95721.1 hypothetical protein [Sphingomonas trueperi]RSV49156.1 hypothetical protein CA233_08835 [Sphingomonas sp. ABOLD]